jgi:hypothetical protein
MVQPEALHGQAPAIKPPRVEDFDELDKKSIDNLVDYMKYVATASGITMGFYAKFAQDSIPSTRDDLGKLLSFSPVLFWFFAILFSVIGVFPRTYKAISDYDKEIVVGKIRRLKGLYSISAISCFSLGFLMFVYMLAATLWKFYPIK